MAGFFDSLLGLDSDPENRDYKRLEEITNPEELEAYKAGQSATGVGIPGLDYARSVLRGLKREVTDPSMGPLGERYAEELDRYRRRQEAFQRLNELYPEAVRGGRLRGSEAIPGAEIGLMAQPTMAGAAGAMARRAARTAPEILEREVGATPRGWDVGNQPTSLPSIIEGEFTEVPNTATPYGSDPFFGMPRTDRATPWKLRRSVFEDPSVDPEATLNARRSVSQEMHAGEAAPEAPTPTPKGLDLRGGYDPTPVDPVTGLSFDVYSPKSKSTLLDLRNKGQLPSPFQRNYLNAQERKGGFSPADIILGKGDGMNPKIYDLLLRAKLGGKPLTAFEQNMVTNYMTSFKPQPTMGIHGENAVEGLVGPPKVRDTTAPLTPFEQNWRKSQQASLNKWREEHGTGIPGAMPNSMRNKAYLEEELPVVYKPYEVTAQTPPILEQQTAKNQSILNDLAKRYNWKTGLAGGAGGILGGVASADKGPPVFPIFENMPSLLVAPADKRTALLPPIDIGRRAAPTAGEKPVIAETAKETARPAPQRAAPRPAARPVSRPAPARKPAPSNTMYYGDYRDVEPFASDPIGNFIDELTGQKKTSRKRGTINSGGSLGDLLPFENGGTVRHHYADGGTDDGFLGDLGDMVGGLFGETEAPSSGTVASDAESPASGGLFGARMSPLSQFLLSSGLAMMAAPTRNPLTAIGQGGLKGLEYLRAAQSAQESLREKELARADRLRQLKLVESLDGPVAEDREETPVAPKAPEMAPLAAPKAPAPAEAPAGGGEAPAGGGGAPSMVPAATEAPSAMPATEKETSPIVAADARYDSGLKARENLHSKISRIMPAVTDPQLRAALANRQRALEYEMNKIEQRQKDAAAERRYQSEAEYKKQEAQQKAFAASPAGVMQKARTEAGAKQVVEDEADIQKDLKTIDTLDTLDSLLDQDMYSGLGADYGSTLATAQPFSKEMKQKGERSREFDRLTKDIVYLAADKKLNAGTSNADIQFLKEKGPNLGLTIEGNRQAIEYMRRAAQRKIDITKREQKYINDHGYLDKGFYEELEQWAKANPLFSKEERKAGSSASSLPSSLMEIQNSGNLQRKGDLFRDKSTGFVYDKNGKRVEQ